MEKQEIIDRLKIEIFDLNEEVIKKQLELQKFQEETQKQINEKVVTIRQLENV